MTDAATIGGADKKQDEPKPMDYAVHELSHLRRNSSRVITVNEPRPAVDQHKQQKLEWQRDDRGRQHHHAKRQQNVGHDQVNHDKRQKDQNRSERPQ